MPFCFLSRLREHIESRLLLLIYITLSNKSSTRTHVQRKAFRGHEADFLRESYGVDPLNELASGSIGLY